MFKGGKKEEVYEGKFNTLKCLYMWVRDVFMPSDEKPTLKVQVKLRHFIPVHLHTYHFESSAVLKSSQTVSVRVRHERRSMQYCIKLRIAYSCSSALAVSVVILIPSELNFLLS